MSCVRHPSGCLPVPGFSNLPTKAAPSMREKFSWLLSWKAVIEMLSPQRMSYSLLSLLCCGSDASGETVQSQLLPVSNATMDLQNIMQQADILDNLTAAASFELAFIAAVPPLGYTTYTLSPVWGAHLTSTPLAALSAASRTRAWLNGTRLEDNTTETQPLVQLSSGASSEPCALLSMTVYDVCVAP